MYLTYANYQSMGGTLDETTFNDYEFEAETVINWFTFNRLKNDTEFPEAVSRCVYRLIYLAKLQADAMSLGGQTVTTTDSEGHTTTTETSATIASQSNDGVSISYNTVSASDAFNTLSSIQKGNMLEVTVQRYLQGVVNSMGRKVLYRGVYPDE